MRRKKWHEIQEKKHTTKTNNEQEETRRNKLSTTIKTTKRLKNQLSTNKLALTMQ